MTPIVLAGATLLAFGAGPERGAGGPCASLETALREVAQMLDRREWTEAEGRLAALPASAGDCGRVVVEQARLRAARADTAEADRLFARAQALAPQDAVVQARSAQYALARGQRARADYLAALALSLDPESSEALVVKGQLLSRSGRTAEGGEALQRAARASNAEAHYQLGVWYFNGKQRSAALQHFEKALALRPRDARAFDYLAMSLESLGEVEPAERAYRQGLAVNDGPFRDPMLDHNYGRFLLKQNRLSDSRTHLDRAVASLPESRSAHYERGKLNLAAQDYAAARKDAERALALPDPGGLVLDLQVYYLLATVYSRLGETELAKKYAELARTTPIPNQD